VAEPRSLSLETEGERTWRLLEANHRLVPGRGCAIVISDSSDVRTEIRLRLETMAGGCVRIEPSRDVLAKIHEIARAAPRDQPPFVWIEVRDTMSGQPEAAWGEALMALNRGRDLVWDGGPVYVVLAGPKWLHRRLREGAPDLSSTIRTALFDETAELLGEPSEPLCWLHLSDLHIASNDWQLDVVLSALLRDLPGLLERSGRKPQLLFVTGDVANRGRADEYDAARRFFEALSGVTGIARERMFMVAGNHDVDRGSISKAVQRSEQLLFESVGEDEDALRTAIDEIFADPDERRRYGQRLTNWCAFTSSLLGPARGVSIDQPWRTDIVDLAGVRVGVASLCTAWLSGASDRKDKLVLGEQQLRTLVRELHEGGAQLRVALMHHPYSWLREAEAETIHAILRAEFDVVLHGHQHRAKGGSFVQGGRDTVEIGAGATYAGLGQDRFHGIGVACLDVAANALILDQFTWSTGSGGHWHLDAGFHPEAPLGRLSVPLRLARIGASPVKGRADALAGRIRRAAVRVHASVAFVGMPSTAPRPRSGLGDIFVPLELRARSPEGAESKHGIDALCERWFSSGATTRAVLLGDPGSGKSTLCKYVALVAAARKDAPAPILLTVREWAEAGATGLLELARGHVEQHLGISCDKVAIETMLREHAVLLLIDGVDEASVEQRVRLRDRLHAFVVEYPRVSVIATSRIVGYDDAALDHEFEHFVLEPFDDGQLRDFIERWYLIAEPSDPVERQRKSQGLRAGLQTDPRIRALAQNPLLATLIALVHFHYAELPGDRAKLYALVVELMVVTWPNARGRRLRELDGAAQLPMLEQLALGMQEERPNTTEKRDAISLTGEQLERRLETVLAEHRKDLDDGRRRALAHDWRDWLVRDAGLLVEQQFDRFAFLHLSLMEHLSAGAVLRERGREGDRAIAEFVVERHRRSQWRETLLLMMSARSSEASLSRLVITQLLSDVVPGRYWRTCMFMLSLLREEVDLEADLRTAVLDAVAKWSCAERAQYGWASRWGSAQSHLEAILTFGRKHRDGVRQWIEKGLAERRGEGLVGLVVVLPESVGPSAALNARSDADLELSGLLCLDPMNRWRRWAAARAGRETWVEWARSLPLDLVVTWATTFEYSELWIANLLRRSAWVADVLRRSAEIWRTKPLGGGYGLPMGVSWCSDTETSLVWCPPSYCVGSEVHLVGPMDSHMWGFRSTDFSSTEVREFVLDRPHCFGDTAVKGMAEYFYDAPRPNLPIEDDTGGWTRAQARPQHTSPMQDDAIHFARLTEEVLDAYLGMLMVLPDPGIFAEIRLANRSIRDSLVDGSHIPRTPTPEQHALILALGLAQYQTTWTWPAGPRWHAYFHAPPPSHWLAAYVWHLCWAVGEPDHPEHLVRAAACLERGDDPELVAELRAYPVVPTPPEVLALFDGRGDPSLEST